MTQPGKFIALEGGEGLGKSTNLGFIQAYLKDAGISVCTTREPGGTPLGEQLRSILLNEPDQEITPDAELLLMFAARAQHIQKIIQPALLSGSWVICDRFTDASYAYQGGGRGVAPTRIATLESWVQGKLRPDLVFLFDAPVELGMRRAKGRGAMDRFEKEQTVFFERVREAYRKRAAADPDRYKIINAEHSLSEVQAQIGEVLKSYI